MPANKVSLNTSHLVMAELCYSYSVVWALFLFCICTYCLAICPTAVTEVKLCISHFESN